MHLSSVHENKTSLLLQPHCCVAGAGQHSDWRTADFERREKQQS